MFHYYCVNIKVEVLIDLNESTLRKVGLMHAFNFRRNFKILWKHTRIFAITFISFSVSMQLKAKLSYSDRTAYIMEDELL